MTANNTRRFIDILPGIVGAYNNTIHSRTKYRPNDVNEGNQRDVFRNLYRMKTTRENLKYNIGDRVRVVEQRTRFGKGYLPNFSEEIHFVNKIYQTFPYYKYQVRNSEGTILDGSYYAHELIKVN